MSQATPFRPSPLPPPTPILAHSSLIIDIIKTLPFFIVAEHYDYQISTNWIFKSYCKISIARIVTATTRFKIIVYVSYACNCNNFDNMKIRQK